jgi:hypothetical protein
MFSPRSAHWGSGFGFPYLFSGRRNGDLLSLLLSDEVLTKADYAEGQYPLCSSQAGSFNLKNISCLDKLHVYVHNPLKSANLSGVALAKTDSVLKVFGGPYGHTELQG